MWLKRLLSLDSWMWCLLKFYELCGFHHSIWSNLRPIKCAIFTVQMILLYHFTLNEVTYIWALCDFMELLGVLNFAIFYGSLLITYWISIIESSVQKADQCRFWTIHSQSKDDCSQWISVKRIYLCEFGVHLVLFVIMLVISVQDKNTTADAIITYYILLFMCNNRLYYFLLYLKIIKFELEQIVIEVKTYHFIGCCDQYGKKLRLLRERYQRAYDMTYCVNGFFGWSNFVSILICFYTLLAYLNWIYQQLNHQFEGHGLLDSFFMDRRQHSCFCFSELFYIENHFFYRSFHIVHNCTAHLHMFNHFLCILRCLPMQ